jgi:hypothetical protein
MQIGDNASYISSGTFFLNHLQKFGCRAP